MLIPGPSDWFMSTVWFSALKHCASGARGRGEAHRGPRARRKNAVAAQPSKGWRCCPSHQISWNTVSRLGFGQKVKYHVWSIHLDADPCALKVLLGSFLFFFSSAGAGCSRLQSWEAGSTRDWLCSVQTPSRSGTPRKVRWYQVWLPQNKLLFLHLLLPSSCC